MTENQTPCAHTGCDCPLDGNAVEVDGKKFCCQKCADGTGCDRPGCPC